MSEATNLKSSALMTHVVVCLVILYYTCHSPFFLPIFHASPWRRIDYYRRIDSLRHPLEGKLPVCGRLDISQGKPSVCEPLLGRLELFKI